MISDQELRHEAWWGNPPNEWAIAAAPPRHDLLGAFLIGCSVDTALIFCKLRHHVVFRGLEMLELIVGPSASVAVLVMRLLQLRNLQYISTKPLSWTTLHHRQHPERLNVIAFRFLTVDTLVL